MPSRALLYRRPTEPQAIEVVCEDAVYLVRLRRHRQARRYTLRIVAVTREAVLTMPPRGSVREAREFAEKHRAWIATRFGRLPKAAPFAHGSELPLRGAVHAIVHRREHARHRVDRDRRSRRTPAVRRRRGRARIAAHHRLSQAAGEARPRGRGQALHRDARRHPSAHLDPRSGEPLGLVLDLRACCRSRGGSSWRRATCSTISPRTRPRISSR